MFRRRVPLFYRTSWFATLPPCQASETQELNFAMCQRAIPAQARNLPATTKLWSFFYMRELIIKKTRVAKWQGGKPTCLEEGYLFFIEQAGLPLCHLARPPKHKNLIPRCARWRPTPESLDFRKIACARLYETDVRRERSVPPWWYPRRGGAPPTPAWTVVTRDEKRWNLCFLSDRLSKLRQ